MAINRGKIGNAMSSMENPNPVTPAAPDGGGSRDDRPQEKAGGASDRQGAGQPLDGTIAVRGGRVVVTDPEAGGQPATIVPGAGLSITVNELPLTAATPVRAADRIVVECPGGEQPASVQVVVSPDRMTASVILVPCVERSCRLADCPPAARLCPPVLEETREEWVLGVDDVMAALAEKGINTGLDREAVAQAVAARDRTARVVARGKPPAPGTDGFVERLFPDGPIRLDPGSEKAAVDHRQRFVLPLVKNGDTLAVLHPAVPGEPGVTVTGEPVPARPVREAKLQAGDNASLAADGLSAMATRSGMPIATGNPTNMTVRVNPVLDHPKDVDLSSGNLIFDGEIVVRGSVTKGMTVRATGGVVIHGFVEGAVVEAGRGIHIGGNVIGGEVRAGGSRAAFRLRHLLPEIDSLAEDLHRLHQACEEVSRRGGEQASEIMHIKAGQALMTLLPHEVKAVQDRFAPLSQQVMTGVEFPEELVAWFQAARQRLLGLGPLSIRTLDELLELADTLDAVTGALAAQLAEPAAIQTPYVQNGILEATGDIEVTGQGCFYSALRAGGGIRVKAAFRGSTATARKHVHIGRAGSPSATDRLCEISVNAAGVIEFDEVFPNVAVRVGHRAFRFDDALTGVRVRLNQSDELQFESIAENSA